MISRRGITGIRVVELKAQGETRLEMEKTYKDWINHTLEPLRDKCDHCSHGEIKLPTPTIRRKLPDRQETD